MVRKNSLHKNKQSVFYITGTDTEVGKTLVSAALLKVMSEQGYSSLGMKPVASGCENHMGELLNSDALLLKKNSTIALDYNEINPYAFQPAIAPHIAAKESGVSVTLDSLVQASQTIISHRANLTIIEGAGGWHVPINTNTQHTLADFAIAINAPVILVVAIKLGCINHALLSVQAIKVSGLPLAGWVANCSVEINDQQAARTQENIQTLMSHISEPLIAVIPFLQGEGDNEEIFARKNSQELSQIDGEQIRVDQAVQYLEKFEKLL